MPAVSPIANVNPADLVTGVYGDLRSSITSRRGMISWGVAIKSGRWIEGAATTAYLDQVRSRLQAVESIRSAVVSLSRDARRRGASYRAAFPIARSNRRHTRRDYRFAFEVSNSACYDAALDHSDRDRLARPIILP